MGRDECGCDDRTTISKASIGLISLQIVRVEPAAMLMVGLVTVLLVRDYVES